MRKYSLKKCLYNICNIRYIGDVLEKLKPVVVYVDRELSDWLEGKVLEGYKKGSLIRRILSEHAKKEVAKNGTA